MTGIEDRIEQMREMKRLFAPTNGLMNRRLPETDDIHKLACTLYDVLRWIERQDEPRGTI